LRIPAILEQAIFINKNRLFFYLSFFVVRCNLDEYLCSFGSVEKSLMNPLKKFLFELQEISFLVWRAIKGLYKGPRYVAEIIRQMDLIGVGSLVIVILTGFFTGGVLILQTYPTFEYYGLQNQVGRSVSTSLIRELGPVLSALMVAGRVGSAIAAELGSMVVSQQIDAMRALGTSPIRKLVTPRVVALILMLPLLTVRRRPFRHHRRRHRRLANFRSRHFALHHFSAQRRDHRRFNRRRHKADFFRFYHRFYLVS
jgi:hypothetical protein